MHKIKITHDIVRAALVKVIADRGDDYVYTRLKGPDGWNLGCKYVHRVSPTESVPGCVFGAALIDLGVGKSHLEGIDDDGGDSIEYVLTAVALNPVEIGADTMLRPACEAVQVAQDSGTPYGELLEIFDGEYASQV